MADWIASNTDFFPLIDIFEDDVTDSKDRLNSGFDKWVKSELWESVSNIDFKKRFNFEPREFQKILSDTIEDIVNPGIFVVEAPMGIGKTEAALFSAEQLAYKLKKTGYFLDFLHKQHPMEFLKELKFGWRISNWKIKVKIH